MDFFGLDEPSEFHLVRNHLQKVTHPHLTIYGHGDYYIEYIQKYTKKEIHNFRYFKYYNQYEKYLQQLKETSHIEVIDHGKLRYKEWLNWVVKK